MPSMYGIFTYILLFLKVTYGFHVEVNIPYMDGMGLACSQEFFFR